ncbi:MAG: uncharacterized protein JWP33_2915 [Blastococcus sp.]|nr:uncharacterized protein [Blastococcus sp.]
MTVRPAGFRAALVGLAAAAALAGCAGTDPSSADAPSSQAGAEEDGGAASGTSAADAAPSDTAGTRRLEVTLAGGQASGDVGRVPVAAGERVTLAITSDVADEVHVHGYDLTGALIPGQPAELTFAATIPGVFEVELHDAGTVLLTLQVQ